MRHRFGFDIDVRVGIHRGIAYLDTAQDDVYGFAANLAARMCSLAEPGTVAVSQAVEQLTLSRFELKAQLPKAVKGVDQPVRFFLVVAERDLTPTPAGPLVGREPNSPNGQAAWAQATLGELRTTGVVFVGEAGIGKSRLAWSAVEMADRSHGVVLQLIGSPFYTDVGDARSVGCWNAGVASTALPNRRNDCGICAANSRKMFTRPGYRRPAFGSGAGPRSGNRL